MNHSVTFLMWLDNRCQRKLGFLSAPLGGLLGGVPVWITTRLVFCAVAVVAALGYVEYVKSEARRSERARLIAAMVQQQVRATELHRQREAAISAAVNSRDAHWTAEMRALSDINEALDAALRRQKSEAVSCWTPDTIDSLAKMARRINAQ